MARTYTKPPLIEAVCDLKFASSQAWDWTIPGIFYKHIRNDFPIKKQINTVDTQVDLQQGKFIQQVVPQLQFASETHDTVMRIAPDMLSIQRLSPYDGWKSFKNRIIEYLELYCESAHPSKLTQVALRYVNHIEIPLDDTELEEYFHVLPQVPTPIPQIFPSFLVNVDVPYDSEANALKIIFGTVVPKVKGNVAYLLGLSMYSVDDVPPSGNHVADWLEVAHERIEVAFNASFTDKTHHEIFGEVRK